MRLACAVVFLALGLASASAEPLGNVKITSDRAPDCSSLESIVASVTRGCKTDDERVIALYNFCRYIDYHHAYPTEPSGVSALKSINVYGWGLCGGLHSVMAALWEKAGYPWRYRGWSDPGHTTVEVFYGGRWHYLDTFLKFYAWMPDPNVPGRRTIAGQEDLRANPGLARDQFVLDKTRDVWYHKDNRFDFVGDKANWTAPAFLVCGDGLDDTLRGIASSRNAGSPRGWASIRFDDPDYSASVDLGPGFALSLDWDRVPGAFYFAGSREPPRHSCGDKDYRNCPSIGPLLEPYLAKNPDRTWSNGTLIFRPDFTSEAVLGCFETTDNVAWREGKLVPAEAGRPAVAVVRMASPYVVVRASGKIDCDGAKLEVSADKKQWAAADLADLAKAVVGKYGYYVRVSFRQPLASMEITSLVQHNQEALPYLAPGMNKLTVNCDKPASLGDRRLAVTYAYCLGSRSSTPEAICEAGQEIGRARDARWSDRPIVVQKVFDSLPATFEIPIPTPQGKQPVYPRMLVLRREVLLPGQKPMDVPVAPSEPKVGANETLATLPNPWTIGVERPPAMPERPTKRVVLPASKTLYVSKKGEVFEHHFVKWLKDNSEAWVFLVGLDRERLPQPKRIAAAKLILYVHEAHDKAPTEVAATALEAAFEPGQKFDFARLGRSVGSTIVAKGDGPDAPFNPPRRYEIDVTRQVRAWAKGENALGLGVRIVPNRGVDDGWTVRFTPVKEKPAEWEILEYTDDNP
jgi:hypothetical protein